MIKTCFDCFKSYNGFSEIIFIRAYLITSCIPATMQPFDWSIHIAVMPALVDSIVSHDNPSLL